MNINEYVEMGKILLTPVIDCDEIDKNYKFFMNKETKDVVLYNYTESYFFYTDDNKIKYFQITFDENDFVYIFQQLILPYVKDMKFVTYPDNKRKYYFDDKKDKKSLFKKIEDKINENDIEILTLKGRYQDHKCRINYFTHKLFFNDIEDDKLIYLLMFKDKNKIKYFTFKCNLEYEEIIYDYLLQKWLLTNINIGDNKDEY